VDILEKVLDRLATSEKTAIVLKHAPDGKKRQGQPARMAKAKPSPEKGLERDVGHCPLSLQRIEQKSLQRPDLSDRVVDPLQISELGEAPQLCARYS
jgi:hypothetical protein